MVEELKSLLRRLDEHEAKSLLLQVFLLVEMADEGKLPAEELAELLAKIRQSALEYAGKERQAAQIPIGKVAHICFSESTAGSLRQMLKRMGREDESVICLPELFSIGPLKGIERPAGQKARAEWLGDHINGRDGFGGEAEPEGLPAAEKLAAIPAEAKVWIWTCGNAHEQTGLRFAVHVLADRQESARAVDVLGNRPESDHGVNELVDRPNPIYAVDTYEWFHQLFPVRTEGVYPLATGEIVDKKLEKIYEAALGLEPLEESERARLSAEWLELSDSDEVLRIWEDGKIKSVPVDALDDLILNAIQKLQKKQEYLPAARVIGEVLGHLEQKVGDSFIEFRLRELAYAGKLAIKGIPKSMRHFQLTLKKS